MFPILSIITFLPLLGGIAILFIPKEHVNAMRWTALAVAWMDLLLALVLILTYSQADVTASSPIIGSAPNGTFLYNEQITWIASLGINYSLGVRSEEHTSELQSRPHLVCRLLLEKKKNRTTHSRKAKASCTEWHARAHHAY